MPEPVPEITLEEWIAASQSCCAGPSDDEPEVSCDAAISSTAPNEPSTPPTNHQVSDESNG